MRLKRVVLKEELATLTGDPISAIVLDQLLYWSRRTRDFDQFIEEEKARDPNITMPLTHGWIYKSAKQLADELMGIASAATIRRRLVNLVENGWVDERHNPNHAWDRTMQYRPNIHAIQRDLAALGYALEGYPLQLVDASISHGDKSIEHSAEAIPETTTETTTENMHTNVDSTTSGGNAKKVDSTYKPDHQKDDGQAHIPKQGRTKKNKGSPYVTRPLVDVDSANVKVTKGNAHFVAVASVCKINLSTATKAQKGQIALAVKKLKAAGATPDQINNFEHWWYKNDWRGKRGQAPAPKHVCEEWGKYENWLSNKDKSHKVRVWA